VDSFDGTTREGTNLTRAASKPFAYPEFRIHGRALPLAGPRGLIRTGQVGKVVKDASIQPSK
jgi:hypothetical protein